jgi:hypothetical protein
MNWILNKAVPKLILALLLSLPLFVLSLIYIWATFGL